MTAAPPASNWGMKYWKVTTASGLPVPVTEPKVQTSVPPGTVVLGCVPQLTAGVVLTTDKNCMLSGTRSVTSRAVTVWPGAMATLMVYSRG